MERTGLHRTTLWCRAEWSFDLLSHATLWMLSHGIEPEAGEGPTTNHLSKTAERSGTPGWSAGISFLFFLSLALSYSLLVCLSFPPLLFIAPSLLHTPTLLSLHSFSSCSPSSMSVQLAHCTIITQIKAINSFLQRSFIFFFFASPPLPIIWLSLFQSQLFSL